MKSKDILVEFKIENLKFNKDLFYIKIFYIKIFYIKIFLTWFAM